MVLCSHVMLDVLLELLDLATFSLGWVKTTAHAHLSGYFS
jgi:hypothetical protein